MPSGSRQHRRSAESNATRLAIGSRVRQLRSDSNLTQAQVAEGLGIRRSAVAKLEGGRRSLLLTEAYALSRLFGCELGDLVPENLRADD